MADRESKYPLCQVCVDRQTKVGVEFEEVEPPSCFICRGLTSGITDVERKMLRRASRYEFKTFTVGVILPPGIQEREDQLRSDLRIRGMATIKSQLAAELTQFVRKTLRKKIERLQPELTFLVNLATGTVDITAKSVFIYGRYTKPRGVSQRRELCENCMGRGCDRCEVGYSRIPSIERVVGLRLMKEMHSPKVKFTWLGSEDPDSIVFPPGRPFVAEVKNPMRHDVSSRMLLKTGRGAVVLTGLHKLSGKPSSYPTFIFKTRAFIESAVPIKSVQSSLGVIKNAVVQYNNNKGKTVLKKVYQFRVLTARGRRMVAEIKLDGGLPVKRLVNGDSVSPSLSELLKTPLNCQRFDILRVWESGGFDFG